MTPVRIAVIGTGMIGRAHIERLLAEPDCKVAGVADPAPMTPARQIRRFCSAISDGEVPRVTREDAMRTLACATAVHAAAKSGSTVTIDSILAAA